MKIDHSIVRYILLARYDFEARRAGLRQIKLGSNQAISAASDAVEHPVSRIPLQRLPDNVLTEYFRGNGIHHKERTCTLQGVNTMIGKFDSQKTIEKSIVSFGFHRSQHLCLWQKSTSLYP